LRTILHVDLDAFYASVEQRDDPSLRGRPVIVGGPSRRGVVLAASYEARPFGARSAMPMAQALSLCPHAVVVPPRMEHYADVSSAFFAVLDRWSPLVEGLSLDEAFLDVTGEERLLGDGPAIARAVKTAVREELSLVASVGVAPCKFVAKIASDLEKPDGLVVVGADVVSFLHPLPVGRLWGVGKKTGELLATLGLRTIGDVARAGESVLAARLGREHARHLTALANGIDDRVVEPDRAPVSIGHEDTFERDVRDLAELVPHILSQGDRACARARRGGWRATIVTLKIKYADHQRTSRRLTLPDPTADGRVVGETARRLLDEVPDVATRGVRLTGVSLSGLERGSAPRQLGFDEPSRQRGEALGAALDKIADKFGRGAVDRAEVVRAGRDGEVANTGGAPRRPRGRT
jgi:DNA polymerase-4